MGSPERGKGQITEDRSHASKQLDFLQMQWLSAWGDFVPQDTLGNVWRQFSLSQISDVGATTMQCVETRDVKEKVLYTFPMHYYYLS